MIQLPDFSRTWDFENNFFLSCDKTRMSKILAQYDLFKMAFDVPGCIVECGVFKGTSLSRFAMLRDLFGGDESRKIIGFDTFEKFPDTKFEDDKGMLEKFCAEAGNESISVEQMRDVLNHKKSNNNIDLIAGDINETIPEYVKKNPALRISLLNLDTDIYEPAVTILEHLYPRIVPGGILVLDDYEIFSGETKAVDDYFKGKNIKIQRLSYARTPVYVVKK
jgi:hypothetical protein